MGIPKLVNYLGCGRLTSQRINEDDIWGFTCPARQENSPAARLSNRTGLRRRHSPGGPLKKSVAAGSMMDARSRSHPLSPAVEVRARRAGQWT